MICTVTKYDVESCTKMLQVVVGCSELQWDVNCHCMLLHDIKYCCHLAYAMVGCKIYCCMLLYDISYCCHLHSGAGWCQLR